MKTILFEGPAHTYLPEIPAYIRFLSQNYPGFRAYNSTEIKDYHPFDFDVVWRFMGLDTLARGRYVVHEYNSLSAGKFPRVKNITKYMLNGFPKRRVFLNKIVRTGFPFSDKIPYGFRDMGIASHFFDVPPKPEYDFVYAGSIHRGPEVLQMLEYFAHTLKEASILIVGSVNPDVMRHYAAATNITFAGRLHYTEMPEMIAKGRYGLNLVPDTYPYNVQTATKVLEYCALGLKVVSMKYRWAENFVQQKEGQFFWLSPDFSNLSLSALQAFDFKTPDVENRRWRTVLEQSGVFDFLKDL
ncbi:MAG: hypothetical protein IT559_07560 [Alphaproteobacteria bacterium]|nr:hypothetical protein [Alphaproteobacteria bacterium]